MLHYCELNTLEGDGPTMYGRQQLLRITAAASPRPQVDCSGIVIAGAISLASRKVRGLSRQEQASLPGPCASASARLFHLQGSAYWQSPIHLSYRGLSFTNGR